MKSAASLFKKILFGIGVLLVLIVVLFGYRDRPMRNLQEEYAPYPSSFIKVDGMAVHYRDEGMKTDSLPLVLLHGTASSLHTFDAWATVLKYDMRVVRLDLPAFGLTSPFPDRNYAMTEYVEFIRHFLAALGIKKCILAGNSLGGNIAWQVAARHPELVGKLILIDAAGYPMVSKSAPLAFKMARIPVVNKLITYITPRFMVKASVENVYADKSKVTSKLVTRYFDLTLREGNRQALVDRMNTPSNPEDMALIKTIRQPTLVLWGAEDQLIPVSEAQRFHRDLPHDVVVTLKGVGHVPMEESPQESLAAVRSFLKNKGTPTSGQ